MTVFRRLGLLVPLAALSLAGCGVNSVPTAEEQVNAEWANLQADYQRRADLIPNLVETVKGYAKQESSVLIAVTQARADAGRVKLTPADLNDPAKVKEFNDAQSRLTQAIIPLQRLQEAYPDLKSNQNFLALQDQLEGTENRINASRRDYNRPSRPITRASAPSRTRSARRSSTAPSPRFRSRHRRRRSRRRASVSATAADKFALPRRAAAAHRGGGL